MGVVNVCFYYICMELHTGNLSFFVFFFHPKFLNVSLLTSFTSTRVSLFHLSSGMLL